MKLRITVTMTVDMEDAPRLCSLYRQWLEAEERSSAESHLWRQIEEEGMELVSSSGIVNDLNVSVQQVEDN